MKQVFSNSIIPISNTDLFDNMYFFLFFILDDIQFSISSPVIVDISILLQEFRNDRVDYKKDYKLWNQVYSPENELNLFREVIQSALSDGKKIHIINCSLREEMDIIRELYLLWGYFDTKENRFMVPFKIAPITIGINVRNLVYSTKNYKSMRESICFIPPPREAGSVKSLFSAINSGVVSTLSLNDDIVDRNLLINIIENEKMSLTTLSQIIYGNYLDIGFSLPKIERSIIL